MDKLRIEVRLTEEQTKYMKEAFDLFDPDETGVIDVKGIMVSLFLIIPWIRWSSVYINALGFYLVINAAAA